MTFPCGNRRDIIAVSTKPDLSLYEEGLERWLETFQAARSIFDCVMTFGIQPVTSNAIRRSNAKGNSLNLVPESQQCKPPAFKMNFGSYGPWPRFNRLIFEIGYTSLIQWQGDEYDDLAHKVIHASGGAIREIAERKGILLGFEFLNDATWDQSPIYSYGKPNVERLLDISRQYDPHQVFQNLQGDGFLLRKLSPDI